MSLAVQVFLEKMAIDGSFSQDGRPVFALELYGHSSDWKIPINAVLDTGFTGFLDLPLEQCLKAGLILTSTATYTLADNRAVSVLLCIGTIVLGKTGITGPVSINMTGKHALLGIDFLRRAKVKLTVDPVNNRTRLL